MENQKINQKILNLWEKYHDKIDNYNPDLLPMLYSKFEKNSVLFIGVNPSFNITELNKIVKKCTKKKINIKEKVLKNNKEIDCDFLIKLEKWCNEDHPYFYKFKKLAEELNFTYQHVDLFYFKETSQKKFKEMIREKNKRGDGKKKQKFELNDFGKEQLKLTKEIIEEINPKLIVVCNAFASDIIDDSDLFSIDKSHFEKYGYDFLKMKNEKIPIVFSSMLTGQRALDNHSFRRLKWIMRKIILK